MQRYTEIPSSEVLANSLSLILNNDKTAMSNNAGNSFPTVNIHTGMQCYREDEKKLYVLTDAEKGTWNVSADLSGDARLIDGGHGNAVNYSKKNLNDYENMPTGFYEGSNMLNSPVLSASFRIIQLRQGEGAVTQMAFNSATGDGYVRHMISGVWTDWANLCVSNASGGVNEGMNADMVDGYHVGNERAHIPVSNGLVNVALNADMVDGYHVGNESGQIPISNGVVNYGLNADRLDDKHAGNAAGDIPISNGKLNVGLNAEMLGGMKASQFVTVDSNNNSNMELNDATITNLRASNVSVTNTVSANKVSAYGGDFTNLNVQSLNNGFSLLGKTYTGSTVKTGSLSYTDGWGANWDSYAIYVDAGISAGYYNLDAVIQKLVTASHSHHFTEEHHVCNCND